MSTRLDLAREGGGRRRAADDVGEWGPPAAAPDAPELPALLRPPVEQGGGEVRPACGRHRPSGRELGGVGQQQGVRRAGGVAACASGAGPARG